MAESGDKYTLYLDIVLQRVGDSWQAISNTRQEIMFCGEGKSQAEAIGSFMISNREALGFQFGFKDGDDVVLSTIYGRRRAIE